MKDIYLLVVTVHLDLIGDGVEKEIPTKLIKAVNDSLADEWPFIFEATMLMGEYAVTRVEGWGHLREGETFDALAGRMARAVLDTVDYKPLVMIQMVKESDIPWVRSHYDVEDRLPTLAKGPPDHH